MHVVVAFKTFETFPYGTQIELYGQLNPLIFFQNSKKEKKMQRVTQLPMGNDPYLHPKLCSGCVGSRF